MSINQNQAEAKPEQQSKEEVFPHQKNKKEAQRRDHQDNTGAHGGYMDS